MSDGALSTKEQVLAGFVGLLVVAAVVVELFFPESPTAELVRVIDSNYAAAALRLTVPIAFAALGGIFAERSGVINIGIEGLLIIAAFTGIATTDALVNGGTGGTVALWAGFVAAVLMSVLFSLIFAAICIDFKADQIIAGLAIWLIALGLAPFASNVIWGSVNSPSVGTFDTWAIPLLSDIPWIGSVLFDATPTVYMLLVSVPFAWYVLNRTSFGRWVRASGENPAPERSAV